MRVNLNENLNLNAYMGNGIICNNYLLWLYQYKTIIFKG